MEPMEPLEHLEEGAGMEMEAGQKRDRPIRVARRVYVGNLAWKTGWQELKDYFGQVGKGACTQPAGAVPAPAAGGGAAQRTRTRAARPACASKKSALPGAVIMAPAALPAVLQWCMRTCCAKAGPPAGARCGRQPTICFSHLWDPGDNQ